MHFVQHDKAARLLWSRLQRAVDIAHRFDVHLPPSIVARYLWRVLARLYPMLIVIALAMSWRITIVWPFLAFVVASLAVGAVCLFIRNTVLRLSDWSTVRPDSTQFARFQEWCNSDETLNAYRYQADIGRHALTVGEYRMAETHWKTIASRV